MRWLITGGCGFIGRNLVRRALANPTLRIRVVDDLSTGARDDLTELHSLVDVDWRDLAAGRAAQPDQRLELVVGDIRDEAVMVAAAAGMDAVVHLAANSGVASSVLDPRMDCTVNVLGTLNCLEACRRNGVPRFVFASSGAPIGEAEPPLHEDLPARPVSPYGASKLAGEAYCSAYRWSFGVDTVALRFSNCYGPGSSHKNSIVAKFLREALAGQSWEIYGDGRQSRDFIYVDDVADAIQMSTVVDGIGGEVFQIATGEETTVIELAQCLAQILAAHRIAPIGIDYQGPRAGDVRRNFSDTRKARARLGWHARVGLREGLERATCWFLERAGRVH